MVLLGACRETVNFTDEGQVCVYSGPMASTGDELHAYAADLRLLAVARSPGCFQTGCFDVKLSQCEVTVQDGEIVIETDFSIQTTDLGQCKSDCRQAETTCTTDLSILEGNYRVIYGDAADELAIPSEREALCLIAE